MRFGRKRVYREVTPDELAAMGRRPMIIADLQRAADMEPVLYQRAVELADARDDTTLEGLYAAVKEVWSR